MYDFAKRPLWILSHVLVVVAVLVMLRLGFWQMDRWQDEKADLDRIELGLESDPVPLDEVLAEAGVPGTADPGTADVPEDVKYRRVVVEGTWDTDAEVIVRNRSLDGRPGGWVLTPLVQDDGTAVEVVRGWVGLELAGAGGPVPDAAPPQERSVVVGVVMLDQPQPSIGPSDPSSGALDSVARVDLGRLSQQVEQPLEPVFLLAESVEPPQRGELPVVVEPELPSPAQNVSYMGQWFIFAAIFAVGYLLILRRVARTTSGPGPGSDVPVEGMHVPPAGDSAEPVDA